jgi:hypothetical protein
MARMREDEASGTTAGGGPPPGERIRPHPSPLRLWGFLVTILGGTLLGIGSLLVWAEVAIGTRGGSFDPEPVKGLDQLDGIIVLGSAIVILLGIPAMRQALTRRGRRAWAIAILVLGLLSTGIALSAALAPDSRLDAGVNDALEETALSISAQTDLPVDEVLDRLEEEAETTITVEPGLWVTAAGGVLAAIGGFLGLLWASKAPLPTIREPEPSPEP